MILVYGSVWNFQEKYCTKEVGLRDKNCFAVSKRRRQGVEKSITFVDRCCRGAKPNVAVIMFVAKIVCIYKDI